MRRSGLGILVFLVVALLVAFLAMKYMQNPTAVQDKVGESAVQAAQGAVDAVNNAMQDAMNDPEFQDSVNNAVQNFQNALTQSGTNG